MGESYCIFVFHGSKTVESENAIEVFSQNIKDKLGCSFSICFLKEKFPTLHEALEQAFIKGFKSKLLTNPNIAKGIIIAAIACKALK